MTYIFSFVISARTVSSITEKKWAEISGYFFDKWNKFYRGDITCRTAHVQIIFPSQEKKKQGIWGNFYGTKINKHSKKVKLYLIWRAALKNNRAYLLHTEFNKSHLNNHICQHSGMKTSTMTSSFYYVFYISLSCNNSIPSFIRNPWRSLLPGNHLKANTPESFSLVSLCLLKHCRHQFTV